MALGLQAVPSVAARALSAAPRLLAGVATEGVGAVAGAAAGTARAGVRSLDTATRLTRAARNTLAGAEWQWRSGARAHFSLRAADPEQARAAGGAHRLAAHVAEVLTEHPDVLFAYWDEGLGRLVVAAAEEAVTDEVMQRAADLAARHGLVAAGEGPEEVTHPADPRGVRAALATLAADLVGTGVGIAAYTLRLPPSSRVVTALVTVLRENPRFRGLLRARLGADATDLLLTCANAAAHAAGQTPTALLLDAVLRGCQLADTVARASAFEFFQDELCTPDRPSVGDGGRPRPPLRTTPAQEYATHATAGSVLGAAATLLVKQRVAEAAEAVLAGSPKAARYGPTAFEAVLGAVLARSGLLVRDPERLRELELAGTIVLHPSAVRTEEGEADPWTEPVLDAARRAGLRVVLVDDPALEDFTGLADQVVDARRPLDDVVHSLPEDAGAVITVARLWSARDQVLLAGLLAGDIAVALTDTDSAVVWSADALALHGLPDVWRLLSAIPAARRVGRRSGTLARSGAALSGLLVAVGESRGGRGRLAALPGLRHAPVDGAAAAALLSAIRAALRVARAEAPHPRARVHWHELGPRETLERLEHEREAAPPEERQQATGPPGHPVLVPVRWIRRLAHAVRSELDDPLTPVLAVGSAASAIVGSAVDALLVVGALDLNALVGGIQRLRAEQAVSGLLADQKRQARVADAPGDPETHTVDAVRLSPGDVIDLHTDDVVPADARVLSEDGLEVDESALTGESVPTEKHTAATPHVPVADRHSMVFEGTTVAAGHARAVVVDTGERTEAARAVHLAARTPPAAGVQARLHELTAKALPLTLAGGAAVTGLALLRGTPIREAVGGGVAVAVAAVPEGLPLVATVAQLAAARRLSRGGVLVRAPRALEALGRMDTVCFDKTGTLTANELRLARATDADGRVLAAGDEAAAGTVRVAARACPQVGDGARPPEHVTDAAVLDAAAPDPDWEQTEGLPFEAARGYAAAVGRAGAGRRVLVLKGAPETVLPACRGLSGDASEVAHELAGRGLRVLAVAQRGLGAAEDAQKVLEQPLEDLEFVGLLGLADTPRETSTALVRGLQEEGIRPVMLTGDHPGTARSIAAELGWPADTVVVTGDDLAAADRAGRARMLRDAGVVARVAPEQKLQVIEALRDAGRVVGMVGDGANDAAAIRAADIGVGINAQGSAAARNAADLVLTDDDLTVLMDAVGEGRALWHSVADAVAILIGGNAGEIGFGILGTLMAGRAPLSTRQMLLVNLFTDLFPAMAVAVTPKEPEERSDPGAPSDVLGAPLIEQIRHRALTTSAGALLAWLLGRVTPGTPRRSGTMALAAVVGTQLVQTLLDRRGSTLVRLTSLGSAAVLVALIETPGASQFFGCTPLGPVALTAVAASVALAVWSQRALPFLERLVTDLVPGS
ncbi:cation-translocating P-type ATPase [Streptomyces arenae]|uniref:cation-translocating P-type ATPase n=1 Tax=Streptomyces arenae TaxID=29301 RepID=UPI0026581D0E|nr:cation-translocating P-type ATPase [Streptomyces arenae]MCG7203632.1 cation-translocating P-type ATPase [Streptomyces arenae]